jgi:hypothetical protein
VVKQATYHIEIGCDEAIEYEPGIQSVLFRKTGKKLLKNNL